MKHVGDQILFLFISQCVDPKVLVRLGQILSLCNGWLTSIEYILRHQLVQVTIVPKNVVVKVLAVKCTFDQKLMVKGLGTILV